MDNLLHDIVRTDPDQVLKAAMASKQATNSVPPVSSEPRMSTIPDETMNNDNVSESNFSCHTAQTSESHNKHIDPVFKVPMMNQQVLKKQFIQACYDVCQKIDKHMPTQYPKYYDLITKRVKSFGHQVIAIALDPFSSNLGMPQAFPMHNSMLMNSMMDFNTSQFQMSSQASQFSNPQFSNQRGFSGFPGCAVGSTLNDTTRTAPTMVNNNRSQTVSSTTISPQENINNGTFMAPPAPPAMRTSVAEPHSASFQQPRQAEFVQNARSAPNASQVGEGSFFTRPANPAPRQVFNKHLENVRKSNDKNPSPTPRASSSVKNSPINMNATMNSTINRSTNSTFSRQRKQDGNEAYLKNWTFSIGRSPRSKSAELYVHGTLTKKCAFGNANEEIKTRAVVSRAGDGCIKTKDGIFYLQGHFQNTSHRVPRAITSIYLTNRVFPNNWKKMLLFWAGLRSGSKAEEEEDVPRRDAKNSPLNSTLTRQKAKEKPQVRKTLSPVKKPVAKHVRKPSPRPTSKSAGSPVRRPVASPAKKVFVKPLSKPPIKTTSKSPSASTPVKKSKSKAEDPSKIKKQAKHISGGKKPESSAIDSSVNSPAEIRIKKKHSRPHPEPVESDIDTSLEFKAKKRKREPTPRYWNENDISQTETEKSEINFADTSNDTSNFKYVSPRKTLADLKNRDSNIIMSQITPPTSYFTNVLSNSDKKSEKIEKTKKTLKRLNDRVVKKGRTSANLQNLGPKLSAKNPKEIKKFIKESDVRLTKVQVHSKSQLESEMSDFSDDVMDEYSD